MRRKHPRLRGEDSAKRSSTTASFETPPLTRGRRTLRDPEAARFGNTPAYAGKTMLERTKSAHARKHPRLRGEDHGKAVGKGRPRETPPLTRGRPYDAPPSTRRVRKHPRLRGEDVIKVDRALALVETPPLTRGRQARRRDDPEDRGNTPAYAGKTRRGIPLIAHLWKHPRLRGEDQAVHIRRRMRMETPPLTRGRLSFAMVTRPY